MHPALWHPLSCFTQTTPMLHSVHISLFKISILLLSLESAMDTAQDVQPVLGQWPLDLKLSELMSEEQSHANGPIVAISEPSGSTWDPAIAVPQLCVRQIWVPLAVHQSYGDIMEYEVRFYFDSLYKSVPIKNFVQFQNRSMIIVTLP